MTPETSLQTLLNTAAVAHLSGPQSSGVGWIRVTGSDRVRWLNGIVTNSIQALQPGEGCYNYFLNAQGRIQGDATAFLESEAILLETDSHRLPALVTLLDRFIIMDDVELADVSAERHGLLITGPAAAAILASLGLSVNSLAPLQRKALTWQDAPLELIHAHSPLVPRYELWAESETTLDALKSALLAAGAAEADDETLEQLRIVEGTPLYGTDIRDKDLPQETAQTRALHFAKGCYLGQEIVERIRSRGNVHRTFSGFVLTGGLPAAGATLTGADTPDKAVGELTSASCIEMDGATVQLALGYIRREALERGQPILYPGGIATPTQFPYRAKLNL